MEQFLAALENHKDTATIIGILIFLVVSEICWAVAKRKEK